MQLMLCELLIKDDAIIAALLEEIAKKPGPQCM